MPRDYRCAQGSQKKGRESKGRDLYAEGYGIGKAYSHNCGYKRQIKAFAFDYYPVLSEERILAQGFIPVQEEEDGEEHAPVADGGGDTTAYTSHFRHAHMSVDKDIVAGNIDQKADNANDHGRSCPAKALEKGTHCNEEQKARQSEKHCLEIP